MGLSKMFDDVLVWKQGFLYDKNNFLTGSKICLFAKGLPMILVKNWKFLPSLLFFKLGLDILSDDVLDKKQGFLYYKNNFLT